MSQFGVSWGKFSLSDLICVSFFVVDILQLCLKVKNLDLNPGVVVIVPNGEVGCQVKSRQLTLEAAVSMRFDFPAEVHIPC